METPTVKQRVMFLAVLYTLVIGCVIIFTYKEDKDYPPRDFRVYQTIYQKDWICWECHTKPIGYGL